MTPAARTYFWRRLETSLKPVFHRTALSWYQKRLRTAGEEEFLLEETLEAVYHAKGAGDTAGVIDYALSYCEHLHRHRLYQEAVSFLCEWIDELKNDAGRMETGDLLLTRLLYLTGLTKSATGEWKAAFECIKRGVLRERVRHRSSITDAKESLRESKSPWRAAIPVQRPVARCREALENALSVYGARHKQVAFRYHDLGALYLAAGDPENAARCLEKVVDIEIRTIGDNNRKSIRSYVALAAAYRAMGEVEKEIDALNRRLDMETYIYGDVHPFLAETLTLLGNVWERTGEIRRAVVLYKKALEMVQACFGHRHHRAAEAHRRLGRVYRAAGKLDEAVNQFESAVEILSMPEASVDPSKEINQGKKHHLTPTKKRRSS
jgi:tetratricopeptide (TPR) repeat protein